jgi:hypothetical protein
MWQELAADSDELTRSVADGVEAVAELRAKRDEIERSREH